MTFLASLTTGRGDSGSSGAATEWQSDVAREITIHVIPEPNRNLDATADKAAAVARAFPGVGEVRVYSKEESAKLLEPWLGSGLSLDTLPVPRLIVVKIASGASPGHVATSAATGRAGAGRYTRRSSWLDRRHARAWATVTATAVGIGVLILMLAANVLSVTFATRGAMATRSAIVIEVLYFVGAKNGFIAGHFQRHFLMLGLQGGAIGGGAAMLLFLLASGISRWFAGTAGGDQTSAMFGSFAIGTSGYIAVLGQVVLIAVVTALTSRQTVNRTLEMID